MTQEEAILKYLQTHKKGLTNKEADEKFGATRLGGVVHNLRKKGHDIRTVDVKGKTRYGTMAKFARYKMGAFVEGSNV